MITMGEQLSLPFPLTRMRRPWPSQEPERKLAYARQYQAAFRMKEAGIITKRDIEHVTDESDCGFQIFDGGCPLHLDRAQREALEVEITSFEESDFGLYYGVKAFDWS